MHLVNTIVTWRLKKRIRQIHHFADHPTETQADCLFELLKDAQDTEWGTRYGFKDILSVAQFRNTVPLQNYESIKSDIKRMIKGEQQILWHSQVNWFAKSSGTTNNKSKLIPVSKEALHKCHYKGGKDMLSLYCEQVPGTKVFSGKTIMMGGTSKMNVSEDGARMGDLSAIIVENLPFWIDRYRLPSREVHLMDSWEEKINLMANQALKQDITSFSGVPSWLLLLMKKVMEKSGSDHLKEVWPNLELFMHGGVHFNPYKSHFDQFSQGLNYMETYNASEGFFGIQYERDASDLLLMLDYGVFYEFIPMTQFHQEQPVALTLESISLGVNYALVITTNAGLWRYVIGDTVMFTCLKPFKIKITGRTTHYINAFGEELIIDNAEKALKQACLATGAVINEYTAAPVYLNQKQSGQHQWFIEFEIRPHAHELFVTTLDKSLKSLNSDYEVKRSENLLLLKPMLVVLEKGVFNAWLKQKQRMGAQYKVPRLSNHREYADDLLSFVHKQKINP